MFRKNKKTHFDLAVAIFVIMFAATAILTGCKKDPPEPPSTQDPQVDAAQPEQVAADTGESAKPAIKPALDAKKSLTDIIKAARTWGPAYQSWYGKPAPDFTLKDLAGKDHKLSDYRGKTVVLVFWATWCPPCQMEVPDLIKLRNDIGEDKLAILAISAEKPDLVKRFVEKRRINYTVLLDTGNMPKPFGFTRVYGTSGVPCSFFIDSEGKIRLGTGGLIALNEIKAILQAI